MRTGRRFRLFAAEQPDSESSCAALAREVVSQVRAYTPVRDKTVLDVGGGGYLTEEFRANGANCYLIQLSAGETTGCGDVPERAVLADAFWLPVRDGGADICVSSDVLQHVRDPAGLIDEIVRITRPGGLIYLSYTNGYSRWGGHKRSPWHRAGAGPGERGHVAERSTLSESSAGTGPSPLHIGPMLKLMRRRQDLHLVSARPGHYPRWCSAMLLIPGLREIAAWNLLLILRRTE